MNRTRTTPAATEMDPSAAPGGRSSPRTSSCGALAELIGARLIASGDPLWRTRPERDVRPLVSVTGDGRLRTESGELYDGPRQAVIALDDARYAPIAWQCFTTADGTCLETLRQLAEPEALDADREPGALAWLIAAGHLHPGQDLEFEMTTGRGRPGQHVRVLATASAKVTDGGWLMLADGGLYANPSPAAAACCGTLTNGWRAWRLAADGRTLGVLRRTAGITPPHRTGRHPGPPVE